MISRRRLCLTNEFAHALLHFGIISYIQLFGNWLIKTTTKNDICQSDILPGNLKKCTFAEMHVECMKRFFFGSVYNSMHVIFILSNFV